MIKYFYLLGAIAGAGSTWWFNIAAFREIGAGFTPQAFVMVGFEGSAMLGSLAADFWVGSTVSLVWMVVEARRLGMRHVWAFVALTFGVAWAFSLPLFLFFRERRLESAQT
ncbi:MAG: DUF2834 domain-containing protein [Sandaracinaceae bacterium]|nr:DUF2834 domain-containing protein [Sandaracinaceae bacterium]